MANSKNLLALFNKFLPFSDFLYILQLEEYSTKRLIKWLPKFFFRRDFQQREQLILTKRALITLLLSFALWVLAASIGVFLFRNSFTLVFLHFCVLFLTVPLFVLVANFIFSLYEEFPKKRIRAHATQKVKFNEKMKVIAIAGSYGKTTVKNFIEQLSKYSFKTQMIPGNINTPGGIANWILGNLSENTELLIAEVDAYEIGEIAKSCDILRPDIAVLTNIGDQHLERFGTRSHLEHALSEVLTHSKKEAICICLDETASLLKSIIGEQRALKLLHVGNKLTYRNESLPQLALSASNMINLQFALAIAEELHIRNDFVMDSITDLDLPERRQQVTTILGFEGIDDSYNISFSTAQAGVIAAKELATQKKKKLLVITAGIPELSTENINKNFELGKILETQADHVVILESMFASEIGKGVASIEKYTLVPSLAHFILDEARQFPPKEWLLLLQPELNDLYY